MRSATMSAWRSEKVRTRSGFRARILSIFAEMNALTRGFSRRACGGRTTYPEIPTIRSCSPSRYSVSTVSSVRQTIRLGGNIQPSPRSIVTFAMGRLHEHNPRLDSPLPNTTRGRSGYIEFKDIFLRTNPAESHGHGWLERSLRYRQRPGRPTGIP